MPKQVGFWMLVCMVFPVVAVTLDADIAILGVQNLSIGRPRASILPSWGQFLQVGTPLGDHGSSRKDTWGPGIRFLGRTHSGAHFESLFGLDKLNYVFFG